MNIHLIIAIALLLWTAYSYLKAVKLPSLRGRHFIIYLPGLMILGLELMWYGLIDRDVLNDD